MVKLIPAVLLLLVGQATAQQSAWGQCGGTGWSGPTSCVSGYYCAEQNAYYSQCIPGSSSGGGSGTGTSGGGGGTGTSTAQQTLCSQYAYWSGNGYDLNNNLWGESAASSGSQCTYLYSSSSSGLSWSTTWNWQGGENNVKSYVNSGRQVQTGRLISSISSMPTSVSWSYSTTNGVRADVAYDLFTASDPNHSTSSGDYELMIWLDQIGGVEPIGGSPSVTNVNVGGTVWNLYIGTIGSQKTFSFVAANGPLTNWSGDIKAFWTYLAQHQGYPQNSQYLLTFQFGTEAFTGGSTQFSVSNWSANVN